jgi:CheY-like chemotaxis protein
MSRILLADHSPHAQRMGERILRDEGYEVATVTDGETALLRLKDLAPDLIVADISLPGRNGYEVCEYVKTSGKYPQTRVVLTAGPVAAYEEQRAQAAGSDGFVRKPFEASLLLNTVQPLIEKPDKPAAPRREPAGARPELKAVLPVPPAVVAPPPRPIDREQVRAAVILALEASMITMIENITDKVVLGLEADARSEVAARAKTSAAAAQAPAPQARAAQAAAATPGPPVARSAETKAAPVPAPEEPVVRIRTPIFRTLS